MAQAQANTMLQLLVVEADAALTEMMVELLVREGCAVTVVASVREAMSRLRDGSVDMMILDADTVPLRAEAHPHPPAPSTRARRLRPSWLVAGSDLPPLVIVSVQAPAAGRFPDDAKVTWLRKPFRNEDFLSAVRLLTGGGAGFDFAAGPAEAGRI
jgi:CheY-like chemotaxis protein